MRFNPFENRKSRDVRNDLGHALKDSVLLRSMEPFESAESSILKDFPLKCEAAHIDKYIKNRKKKLCNVLDRLNSSDLPYDSFSNVCIVLWEEELYFEFHEWIEEKWLTKEGDERKALQALIQAAVVFEHLEYERIPQAQKVAKKAVTLFRQFRESFPKWVDTDEFVQKLEVLEKVTIKY